MQKMRVMKIPAANRKINLKMTRVTVKTMRRRKVKVKRTENKSLKNWERVVISPQN